MGADDPRPDEPRRSVQQLRREAGERSYCLFVADLAAARRALAL